MGIDLSRRPHLVKCDGRRGLRAKPAAAHIKQMSRRRVEGHSDSLAGNGQEPPVRHSHQLVALGLDGVAAAAMGSPRAAHPRTGRIAMAPNIAESDCFCVAGALTERPDVPVRVENNVNGDSSDGA